MEFSENIQKVSIGYLDELYNGLAADAGKIKPQTTNGKLNIYLSNSIRISRIGFCSLALLEKRKNYGLSITETEYCFES